VQPIFTTLAKPYDQTVFTIVFVDHCVVVAVTAIHKAAETAETVNLAVSGFVNVFWIDH
jgi:hypothetical protein